MKNIFTIIGLLLASSGLLISCGKEKNKTIAQPTNYTVVLDLSDRILTPEQLDKDFYLIQTYFKCFETKARKNLVLSSKDRFSIKIIPQKNSPLNLNHYQDLLQLNFDEIEVQNKNKSLLALSQSLSKVLQNLKKDALYSKKSTDYFGVDIWAYLHDNGKILSKYGYENNILVLTDGYFDFENQAHVIKNENQYTSTGFLTELSTPDWKQIADSKQYGLLPIELDKKTKWIVAGIMGKKANDILQTEKITYFWKKWLLQSGVTTSNFILNGSKTEMNSGLLGQLH